MSNHSMPLLRSFALLASVSAVLVSSASARADDAVKTVEATGEAAVMNGDEPTAKDKAKKAAQRDAVEKVVGTFLASDTQTKDMQAFSDNVTSHSEGYIKNTEVLDSKCEAGVCSVHIRATVASGKINADASARGLLLSAMKFPRMAVLIAEQSIGQEAPSAWWGPQGGGKSGGSIYTVDERQVENLLIQEWTDSGFSFVDMDALAGKLKAANLVSNDPSKMDPRTIANLTDADVIIMGTAIASSQGSLSAALDPDAKPNGMEMKSCKGSISARVFNADNGEILATSAQQATTMHIETLSCGRNALQKAAKLFADDLQGKLLRSWNKSVQGGSRIRMAAKGVDFHSLKELEAMLLTMRGVSTAVHKNFKDGSADIDVGVQGSTADELASDIDGKSVGKLKVKVTGNSSNTISIELGK